jgi:hypothetical protein
MSMVGSYYNGRIVERRLTLQTGNSHPRFQNGNQVDAIVRKKLGMLTRSLNPRYPSDIKARQGKLASAKENPRSPYRGGLGQSYAFICLYVLCCTKMSDGLARFVFRETRGKIRIQDGAMRVLTVVSLSWVDTQGAPRPSR